MEYLSLLDFYKVTELENASKEKKRKALESLFPTVFLERVGRRKMSLEEYEYLYENLGDEFELPLDNYFLQ